MDKRVHKSAGLSPIVYCGIRNVDESGPGKVFEAVKGYMADGWTGDFSDGHDIAVLKLDRRATNLTLPLLGSGGVPITYGDWMTAVGWEKTESVDRAKDLRAEDRLTITEHKSCEDKPNVPDNSSWICIDSLSEDTCEGSMDGPLLLADAPNQDISAGNPKFDMIIGVASCGSALSAQCSGCEPAVYTNVDHYLDWIREITKRHSKLRVKETGSKTESKMKRKMERKMSKNANNTRS